ncbi:unnamed protein product [Strongylus vulgaris]|uniref:Uncharacterized protein n=1 Tax=Strongylus vulgaris TaxID=40348 RepID=A0A3P7LNE9_STRVU|nr:unnamed protein product [Strongylus vulgaris]
MTNPFRAEVTMMERDLIWDDTLDSSEGARQEDPHKLYFVLSSDPQLDWDGELNIYLKIKHNCFDDGNSSIEIKHYVKDYLIVSHHREDILDDIVLG